VCVCACVCLYACCLLYHDSICSNAQSFVPLLITVNVVVIVQEQKHVSATESKKRNALSDHYLDAFRSLEHYTALQFTHSRFALPRCPPPLSSATISSSLTRVPAPSRDLPSSPPHNPTDGCRVLYSHTGLSKNDASCKRTRIPPCVFLSQFDTVRVGVLPVTATARRACCLEFVAALFSPPRGCVGGKAMARPSPAQSTRW